MKLYFVSGGVFFSFLPLPVSITIISRMPPGADDHQTSITSPSAQQCTLLCVRGPRGMFLMCTAHLGKYLGFAHLLGIEVCFLSHGNHQFLSTNPVQITAFHTKTHCYGEITVRGRKKKRAAVLLETRCALLLEKLFTQAGTQAAFTLARKVSHQTPGLCLEFVFLRSNPCKSSSQIVFFPSFPDFAKSR